MATRLRNLLRGARWIDDMPDLPELTPGYVLEQLEERIRDLSALPADAQEVLESARGLIVDAGPGEGVSSMALALSYPDIDVLGIEMDWRHLKEAWPECAQLPNLELAWGSLPGTPSNLK